MLLRNSRSLDHFESPVFLDFSVDLDLSKSYEERVNEADIKLEAVINPKLLRLIERCGFTRRGSKRHIYAMSSEDNGMANMRRFIKEYTETFQLQTLLGSQSQVNDIDYISHYQRHAQPIFMVNREPMREFAVFPAGLDLTRNQIDIFNERNNPNVPRPFMVFLERKLSTNMIWLRILKNPYAFKSGTTNMTGSMAMWENIDADSFTGDFAKYKEPLSPFTYKAFVKQLAAAGLRKKQVTERSSQVFEFMKEIEHKVLVSYKQGKPAVGVIRVGYNIGARVPIPQRYFMDDEAVLEAGYQMPEITIQEALSIKAANPNLEFLLHPALADIAEMSEAPKFDDARLREYQMEAVGLHLSTGVGYLNACSPGLGKTVMQLSSMRERAAQIPGYKALIMTEMNVLSQWTEELAVWFPEAKTVITKNNSNLADIAEVLASSEPGVVLMPYNHLNHVYKELERVENIETELAALVRVSSRLRYLQELPEVEASLGSLLLNATWNDIAADEAMVIRNNSSKQAKAAWKLRENSEVAVALTGTPLNKAVSDIANLISWVRNDKKLFRGIKFEEEYNLEDPAEAKALFDTFGPLIFRRDTSEIKDELPKTNAPAVALLDASPGERALIETAENEMRRCYQELLQALDNVEVNRDNEEEIAALKAELSDARKAWLGGKTLARMATSDPIAVGNSESIGATLLVGQGLVAAALETVPTKRKKLVEEISVRVEAQQQSLVFVEFEATANILRDTLVENGIKAEVFSGRNRDIRDSHRIAFQAGELDVLVITQAGERGLTLNKAAAVYCYDLPWTPEKILQRIGRAVRIGASNESVDIIFMVMKDTIEEKIANVLVTRAVNSVNLLDSARGVEAKETEVMGSLGGLVKTMASRSESLTLKAFGEML